MNIFLDDADEEVKRADHLIYVSLKYTRTVDIIKSIIERLINTFDFCHLAILTTLKEKGIFQAIPKSPGLRSNMISDYYKHEEIIQDFMRFYQLLRSISRAEFKRSSEYRRHVKMTSFVEAGPVEIDIDKISEYFRKTRIFVEITKRIVTEEEATKEPVILDLARLQESVIVEIDFNRRGR